MSHTPCKNCVFAQWEGKTQTGCAVGLLDKHAKSGREIVEVYDEEDDEFFVVKGNCHWFRHLKKWQKIYSVEGPIELLIAEARKEQTIEADAIIYIDDDSTLNDVQITTDSLVQQELRFKTIVYCLNTNRIKPDDILKIATGLNQRWRVERILDNSYSKWYSIDITAHKVKVAFYSLFKAGYHVPIHYLSTIDRLLNDEAANILAILPEDDNGLFVSKRLHDRLDGNHEYQLEHKIEHICKEEKCLEKIVPLSKMLIM